MTKNAEGDAQGTMAVTTGNGLGVCESGGCGEAARHVMGAQPTRVCVTHAVERLSAVVLVLQQELVACGVDACVMDGELIARGNATDVPAWDHLRQLRALFQKYPEPVTRILAGA